jgi:VWFA-related protein
MPWLLLSLIIVLSLSILPAAQEQSSPGDQPYRAETATVVVDVVVRDRRGRPMTDLAEADFEIYEDGVRQAITSFRPAFGGSEPLTRPAPALPDSDISGVPQFAAAPAGPRVVALVFDRMSQDARDLGRQAALTYVEEAHGPDDRVGVFSIDFSLKTLQDYTEDEALLRAAVERAALEAGTQAAPHRAQSRSVEQALTLLERSQPATIRPPEEVGQGVPPRGNPEQPVFGGGPPDPDILLALMTRRMEMAFDILERDQRGYTTTNALLSVIDSLTPVPGRKTLIFFSEGVSIPPAVQHHFLHVIDAANAGNVSVYALDATGLRVRSVLAETRRSLEVERRQIDDLRDDGGIMLKGLEATEELIRRNPESGLGMLANETAGLHIRDTNDLRGGMRHIADDLRNHYLVGYAPTNETFDGRFRTITVKVKRPGVEIRARKGYHAVPATDSPVPVLGYEAPAVAMLESERLPDAFPVRLSAFSFPDPARPGLAPVLLAVGTDSLEFRKDGQLYTSDFTILVRARDAQGRILRKLSQQYTLRGPVQQLEQAKQGEVLFYRDPELPAGTYTLEAIVYDALGDRASARVATLDVPPLAEGVWGMSSLLLVARTDNLPEEERDSAHPLHFDDMLLYPNLGAALSKGSDKMLSFFTTIYPGEAGAQALGATLTLLHEGQPIAQAPAQLPAPDASGRIRYVGTLPLEKFPEGRFELRVTVEGDGRRETRAAFFAVTP